MPASSEIGLGGTLAEDFESHFHAQSSHMWDS